MPTVRLACTLLALLFLPLAPGPLSAQPADDATTVIRTIYDQAAAACNGNARFDPYAVARSFFEPELAGRYTRALKSGKIDFDVFVAGQDCELADVQVAATVSSSATATVRASFKNFGQPMTIDYDLRKGETGWKIREIAHRHEPFSLRSALGLKP